MLLQIWYNSFMVEELKFIRTFGPRDRVGILPDDTWVVLFEQPNHRLVPHRHQDVFSVLTQNKRVIQRFLGVPVKESAESGHDPELRVSLPQLRELIIWGETQKAQNLAGEIVDLMSLSINLNTPHEELKMRLQRLKRTLGPGVRNEFKVKALGKLQEAEQAPTIAGLHVSSAGAYESLLLRAMEGMSITASLMDRAANLLGWVNEQENELGRLKNSLGAALREMDHGTVPLDIWQQWHFGLFGRGEDGMLERISRIRGNPYHEIVNKPEIRRLARLNETMQNPLTEDSLALVQRRFQDAYPILFNVEEQRQKRHQN